MEGLGGKAGERSGDVRRPGWGGVRKEVAEGEARGEGRREGQEKSPRGDPGGEPRGEPRGEPQRRAQGRGPEGGHSAGAKGGLQRSARSREHAVQRTMRGGDSRIGPSTHRIRHKEKRIDDWREDTSRSNASADDKTYERRV